jgi:hypothetical protein
MVAKALDWLVGNISEFDPFKGGRPFEIKHGQKVGELAILLHAYASLTGDRDSEHVERIVSLLASVQKNPAFTDRLLRSPVEFVLFAEVYASLRSLGHDDPNQRELIQRVIDAHFLDHTERLPHRTMDIVSCLEWGEFRHAFPSLESLYASSILGRVPMAAFLDEDALYFLTHVIMFLYGFGIRKDVTVPAERTQNLGPVLSALLISCSAEHHWDLLAELLMCWDCIGLAPTFVSERAWEVLLQLQKEDGAIPGPEWAEKLHQAIEQKQKNHQPEELGFYFDHHYHTTLVSIIAGSLHLNRLESPTARQQETVLIFEDTIKQDPRNLSIRREASGPLSPDKSRLISRARQWLDQLIRAAAESEIRRPEVLSRILLGYWICDSLTATTQDTFPAAARRVGEALTKVDLRNELDWSKTTPALKLIVASLLSSQEVFVPFLHSQEGFLRRAVMALNGSPPGDATTDMLLCEKRVLLHVMGLHPRPGRIDCSEVRDFARALPLTDPQSCVDELLLRIHSYTLFGTSSVEMKHSDHWIAELLSGLAMTFFRKYDLLMGCRILRSLGYLVGDRKATDTCLDFLSLHQRVEGSFGFFGPEKYGLLNTTAEKSSLEVNLTLPITIECLWTLGEGNDPRWRLYQTFPQVGLTD